MTLSRPEVQRLLADHGLRPSRALGQNFVVDPNTVRRIVRLAGVTDGAAVVEVGAGLGSLTLALAEAGAQVVAVEVDRGLVPILRQIVADRSVTVVEADALQVDWDELLGPLDRAGLPGAAGGAGLPGPAGGAGPWSLVANLPYNVATPLVVQVLEQAPQVGSLLVMVQREVGERLAARPGQAAYGAVSVVVDYWAEASVVGRVPPTVFVPRPNVESALVRIDRRPSPAVPVTVVTYDRLRQVVRAGFAQRRKMLRRSLAGVVPAAAFAATDIAPEARAEELNVVQWGRLAGWTEET
ncbi:MAG TPA: 16S rRNA (adenine(1518)-N(6)/adenine(1519)-N(6))-dimethyltransferase RsmA [Acidimicrobiales bacterium]